MASDRPTIPHLREIHPEPLSVSSLMRKFLNSAEEVAGPKTTPPQPRLEPDSQVHGQSA